jgi:hypothetical protein
MQCGFIYVRNSAWNANQKVMLQEQFWSLNQKVGERMPIYILNSNQMFKAYIDNFLQFSPSPVFLINQLPYDKRPSSLFL